MGGNETAVARNVGLRRAVFLDRDGVLNRAIVREGKPYPPAAPGELELMPGVLEGCRRLKEAGFLLIVATNQPDVGRGTQSRHVVEEMHRLLREMLPLDGIEVCYDGGPGPSEFSKPAPGMLLKAAGEWGIDLERSFMVGDRWRDVDCGRAAGCVTIFMDHDYRETLNQDPHYRVGSFSQAVKVILATAPSQA